MKRLGCVPFLPLSGCSVASSPPSCSWTLGMSEKYQKSWRLTQVHVETWNNLWVGKLMSLSAVCNQGNEMNPDHRIWNHTRKCPLLIIFLRGVYSQCQEQTPHLLQCKVMFFLSGSGVWLLACFSHPLYMGDHAETQTDVYVKCYPSSALGLKCSCRSSVWITGNLICWVERVKWTLTEKLYLSLSG